MTREKALIMALKIVNTCKKYGNEDRCRQCPFNINGCIVSDGDGTLPNDWRASEIVTAIEIESMKADNGKRG
jgi:hypothetical protein